MAADALAAFRARTAADAPGCFRFWRAEWSRRTALPFLAGAAVVAGAMAYQFWFYRASPGWRDFYTYNWLRGQFTDYARDDQGPATEQALSQAGWSRNDYRMLKMFFFADPEVY